VQVDPAGVKVVLEQYHLAQERRRVHESRYANSIIPQAEWGTYLAPLSAGSGPVSRLGCKQVNYAVCAEFVDETLDGEANNGAVRDVYPSHDACRSACP
jgi:hypothetical protein